MASDPYAVTTVRLPPTASAQAPDVLMKDRPAPVDASHAVREKSTDEKSLDAQAGTAEQVTRAVERINEMIQNRKQTLTFEIDEESGRLVIRVMDAQTQELIRQIPSEETLKFAQYVDGLVGLIFNKKA